jgi:hypothetical protein
MDMFGWCDGLIKMKFGAEIKSEVAPSSADPEFLEELQLPVMTPSMSDAIEVSLWDDDMVTQLSLYWLVVGATLM